MAAYTTNIPFTLSASDIDYFQLKEEYFTDNGFTTEKEFIKLETSEDYVEYDKHLGSLNLGKKETVVLNFQVGKGKTSLCYKLIKEYYNRGYYVIICSPFIKLVLKDKEEIVNTFPTVIPTDSISKILWPNKSRKTGLDEVFYLGNYTDEVDMKYNRLFVETAPYERRIHTITINTLLGNAGDEDREQNYYKRKYLYHLLKATKEEKVVLFLDEVHESVHNFKSKLIPNLLRWNKRIEKVFIASATYTPASIPLIKTAALLTEKSIKIYELPRSKNKKQAKIFLHISTRPYSSKAVSFLSVIQKTLSAYRKSNQPVNIICGSKALAENLAEKCFGKNVVQNIENVEPNKSLDFINLSTSDTGVPFQSNQNNIGTTFKTGINIEDPKHAVFIIFPSVRDEQKYRHYGIFSHGIPAVIQAVGRLRKGGEMHLFIHDPEVQIGDTLAYPTSLKMKEFQPHLHINNSLTVCLKEYTTTIQKIENQIRKMETAILKQKTTKDLLGVNYKYDFGFWYPNQHEYLLNNSNAFLLRYQNPSFGKWLSPYILWACLHDQFANATLRRISYYNDIVIKSLGERNAFTVFKSILQQKQSYLREIGFRGCVDDLAKHIGYINDGSDKTPVSYRIKDKSSKSAKDKDSTKAISPSVLINREIGYTKTAIRALYQTCTGNEFTFDDRNKYLLQCLKEAEKLNASSTLTSLQNTYLKLSDARKEFVAWFKTKLISFENSEYISNNAYEDLDDAFIIKVKGIIKEIQEKDEIIKTKSISLLQNLETFSMDTVKKSIYNELRSLTFKVSPGFKHIKKEKCYKVLSSIKANPSSFAFL
jgi:hypothetical protein